MSNILPILFFFISNISQETFKDIQSKEYHDITFNTQINKIYLWRLTK